MRAVTPALTAAALAALPAPASAAQGWTCVFDSACADRRPCYPIRAVMAVVPTGRADLVELHGAERDARLARVHRQGIWISHVTDDDLGRTLVLDIGPEGAATLVESQPAAPPHLLTRSGTCTEDPAR